MTSAEERADPIASKMGTLCLYGPKGRGEKPSDKDVATLKKLKEQWWMHQVLSPQCPTIRATYEERNLLLHQHLSNQSTALVLFGTFGKYRDGSLNWTNAHEPFGWLVAQYAFVINEQKIVQKLEFDPKDKPWFAIRESVLSDANTVELGKCLAAGEVFEFFFVNGKKNVHTNPEHFYPSDEEAFDTTYFFKIDELREDKFVVNLIQKATLGIHNLVPVSL